MLTAKEYRRKRLRMVDEQLILRGINDRRVLDAMRMISRHEFIDPLYQQYAYDDIPLPIDSYQTLSQPYIIAFMTERLRIKPNHHILEIGTGSGYQTTILSRLAAYVYSLERSSRLADSAGERLSEMNCRNVDIHLGDGSQGLADMAPFDGIMVTAAVPNIPKVLCTQLKYHGGRMIIPVGDRDEQEMRVITRRGDKYHSRTLMHCQFVPLVGRYGFPSSPYDESSLV